MGEREKQFHCSYPGIKVDIGWNDIAKGLQSLWNVNGADIGEQASEVRQRMIAFVGPGALAWQAVPFVTLLCPGVGAPR